MKKVTVVIILSIFALSDVCAQWTTSGTNIYNSNTGNVGIGVSTPIEKLQVHDGNILMSSNNNPLLGTLKFSTTNFSYAWAGIAGKMNGQGWDQIDLLFYTAYDTPSEKMRLMSSTGYLGIGTSTPAAKLHSMSTGEQLRLGYDATNYSSFTTSSTGGLTIAPSGGILNLAGNVGIGTASPQVALDVVGTIRGKASAANDIVLQDGGGNTVFRGVRYTGWTDNPGTQFFQIGNSNDNVFYTTKNGSIASRMGFSSGVFQFTSGSYVTAPVPTGIFEVNNGTSALFNVLNGGNIGIGTTVPAAKLDVNGTTYSRKLYVGTPDANTITNMGTNLLAVNGTAVFVKAKVAVYGSAWPDYVFSPDYKLTPLDSLEQFIQLNKHLPDVPSADEVQKDGVDLGNNQALLLKKIEELTLIVIEQNKKQENLQNVIIEQNKRIEKLEVKLQPSTMK